MSMSVNPASRQSPASSSEVERQGSLRGRVVREFMRYERGRPYIATNIWVKVSEDGSFQVLANPPKKRLNLKIVKQKSSEGHWDGRVTKENISRAAKYAYYSDDELCFLRYELKRTLTRKDLACPYLKDKYPELYNDIRNKELITAAISGDKCPTIDDESLVTYRESWRDLDRFIDECWEDKRDFDFLHELQDYYFQAKYPSFYNENQEVVLEAIRGLKRPTIDGVKGDLSLLKELLICYFQAKHPSFYSENQEVVLEAINRKMFPIVEDAEQHSAALLELQEIYFAIYKEDFIKAKINALYQSDFISKADEKNVKKVLRLDKKPDTIKAKRKDQNCRLQRLLNRMCIESFTLKELARLGKEHVLGYDVVTLKASLSDHPERHLVRCRNGKLLTGLENIHSRISAGQIWKPLRAPRVKRSQVEEVNQKW